MACIYSSVHLCFPNNNREQTQQGWGNSWTPLSPLSPGPCRSQYPVRQVGQWLNYLVLLFCMISAAKSRRSCSTLCDPIDGSPPGSPVPGILQARTLEWVAISFSSALKWKVKVKSLSRVQLFATTWTVACQAPPSKGFPRQEYWSGVPLPSPGAWSVFLSKNLLGRINF